MNDPRAPLVMWELTRACRAGCSFCPAGARSERDARELSTWDAYRTVDQIVSIGPRELIISGGDPLERKDLFQLIDYARRRGLDPALTVSGTPLLDEGVVRNLSRVRLTRIILGLDAGNPHEHNRVRGGGDSFAPALLSAQWAHLSGMAVEVNTLATPAMARHAASFIELLEDMAIDRWNVFFLVPSVGSRAVPMLTSLEVEDLFAVMAAAREKVPFRIRAFEAPQFGRYLMQQGADALSATTDPMIFISDRGAITPGPFFPGSAGDVRRHSLRRVYEASPLFERLRDRTLLNGKCGQCEYRDFCGGSRARALAMTGDLFGSDPLCVYQPVPHEGRDL